MLILFSPPQVRPTAWPKSESGTFSSALVERRPQLKANSIESRRTAHPALKSNQGLFIFDIRV